MYWRTSFRLGVVTTILAILVTIKGEQVDVTKFETVHNSNEAILQRLGLVPLRIPDGHHKKRLSGPEPLTTQTRIHQPYSRRHGHHDSHVYVVKLPPSQPYYTLTKPHKTTGLSRKDNEKSPANKKTDSGNSSPRVGFQSNGKPGKIYHWNLPLVKKINDKKRLHTQLKIEQMRKRLEGEIKDERLKDRKNHRDQSPGKANSTSSKFEKKSSVLSSSKKSSSPEEFNAKHHRHSTSVNSLGHDERPVKHTRNNDKRLNYPRIPEELRKSGRPQEKNNVDNKKDNEKTNKNNKKMYRLEDSNLYSLDSLNNNERHENDRLAVWSLSNELHASGNTQNSLRPKKHRKKAAMSYYAPINSRSNKIDPSTATNIQKNFPGNGKPKAFYVMEKSRQPVYYHPLLP